MLDDDPSLILKVRSLKGMEAVEEGAAPISVAAEAVVPLGGHCCCCCRWRRRV